MFSLKKPHLDSEITSFEAPPTLETHPTMRSSAPHKRANLITSINTGLTVLALLSAITIVGTSADTVHVYNTTSVGEGGFLSMWPNEFDLRPTVALVVCGAVILVASALSLGAGKIGFIQTHTLLSTPLSLLFPSTSLIAALISTSFFYGINTSSTNYTLQTWTCQWENIPMNTKPHWSALCKESKVALYLSVMMIPLQLLVLGTVVLGFLGKVKGWVSGGRRGSETTVVGEVERKGSPSFA